jgi:patatin-like phospholipase/acyl hydrolase
MNKCADCGSHSINYGKNERPEKLEQTEEQRMLCDVCYWKQLYFRFKKLSQNH